MAHASDDAPIFSRHNINDNVIFTVQKLPLSFSFPEDVVKKVAATWTSPISSRLSMISNFSLFNVEEAKLAVPVRDAYDSWPFIRSEIENDITEVENEGNSVGSIIKAALNYGKF